MEYLDLVKLLEDIGNPIVTVILGIAVYVLRQEVNSLRKGQQDLRETDRKDDEVFMRKDLFSEVLRSHNETHERFQEDIRDLYRKYNDLERRHD